MRPLVHRRCTVSLTLIASFFAVLTLSPAAEDSAASDRAPRSEAVRVAFQPRKKLPGGPKVRVTEKSDSGRNDVEGTIWQYTATLSNTKEPPLNGEFRIKGQAIYAPAKDFADGSAEADKKSANRSEVGPPPRGEKRVGDVIVNEKSGNGEMQLVFTHYKKLQGRAVVKRQSNSRSTANLLGNFQAKDGKRWRFEMRRAED